MPFWKKKPDPAKQVPKGILQKLKMLAQIDVEELLDAQLAKRGDKLFLKVLQANAEVRNYFEEVVADAMGATELEFHHMRQANLQASEAALAIQRVDSDFDATRLLAMQKMDTMLVDRLEAALSGVEVDINILQETLVALDLQHVVLTRMQQEVSFNRMLGNGFQQAAQLQGAISGMLTDGGNLLRQVDDASRLHLYRNRKLLGLRRVRDPMTINLLAEVQESRKALAASNSES